MLLKRESFSRWLYQPKVGAAKIFKSLQNDRTSSRWSEWIFRNSSWLLFLSTLFITWVPFSQGIYLNKEAITKLLLYYLFYILFLEIAGRKLRTYYDHRFFQFIRVAVNLLVVSLLVWFSSGANSYFWFFYSLPIFQAIIYFDDLIILALTFSVILIYTGVSALFAWTDIRWFDAALVSMNGLVLGLMAFVLYWLFGSAKENRILDRIEMDALRQTAHDLAAHVDREDLLKIIVRRAVELLTAKGGGIYEYDSVRDELTVVADWGNNRSIVGSKLGGKEGMAGYVVQTGESLIENDYDRSPRRAAIFEQGLFKAVVEVPLLWDQRLLGVLFVTDDRNDRHFKERDAYLLRLLASQAVIALLEESRRRADVMERKARQLEVLNKLNTRMSIANEWSQIMRTVLSEGLTAVGATDGSIMLVDPSKSDLEIQALLQKNRVITGGGLGRFEMNQGIAGFVCASGQFYNCHDTLSDANFVASKTGRSVRSVLSVPMISNGNTIGVINTDSAEPYAFGEEEVRFLSALAGHLTTVIENFRLFKTTQRNLEQLQVLNGIVERISTSKDLADALQTVLQDGLQAIRAVDGSIMLIDPLLDQLEIKARKDNNEFSMDRPHRKLRIGQGIAGYVAQTAVTRNSPDVLKDEHFDATYTLRGFRSLLSVPIVSNGCVLGVINSDSQKVDYFGRDDAEFLSALAAHIAIAYQAHCIREFDYLFSTLSLPDLLTKVVETAAALTGAEFSTLFLINENTDTFERTRNFPPDRLAREGPRPNGLSFEILRSGVPLIIQDAQKDVRVKKSSKDQGIQSIMGVPLTLTTGSANHVNNKMIGVLFVNTIHQRNFTHRAAEPLQRLANQAAIAIQNARQHYRLKGLMESAVEAIVAVDRHGIITQFNREAERILGYHEAELRGEKFSGLYYDIDDAQNAQRSFESGRDRVTDVDMYMRSKSREKIPIRLSTTRLLDYDGAPVGTEIFFRDLREIRSAGRLESLYDFSAVANPTVGRDEILKNGLRAMVDVFRVDHGGVVMFNETKGYGQTIAEYPMALNEPATGGMIPLRGCALIDAVRQKKDCIFIEDVETNKLVIHDLDLLGLRGIKSVLIVPLLVDDRIIGTIGLDALGRLSGFTKEETHFAQTMAKQIALACENADLYQLKARQSRTFRTLYEISLDLTTDHQVIELMQTILYGAINLLEAENGSIYLIDHSRKYKILTVASGMAAEFMGKKFDVGVGVTGLAIRDRKSHSISDYSHSPYRIKEYEPYGIEAVAAAPIQWRETTWGAIAIGDTKPTRDFNKDDLELLQYLGNLAAFALQNADQMDRINWAKQVESFNLVEGELGHLINDGVSSIRLGVRQVRDSIGDPKLKEALDRVDQYAEGLWLPPLPTAPGTTSNQVALSQVDHVIREDSKIYQENWPGIEFKLKLHCSDAQVGIHPGWLRRLIRHLVRNAAQNMPAGKAEPRIVISSHVVERSVEIDIEDNGDGVPMEIVEQAFQHAITDRAPRGRGLLLTRFIAEYHNGWVKLIRNDPGKGATFRIWLPIEAKGVLR